MLDVLIAIASTMAAFLLVVLFIILGWYIVWKLFLSKFVLVRQLLGYQDQEATAEENTGAGSRAKRTRRD